MGYILSGSAGKHILLLVGIVVSLLSDTGDCRVLSIRDFGAIAEKEEEFGTEITNSMLWGDTDAIQEKFEGSFHKSLKHMAKKGDTLLKADAIANIMCGDHHPSSSIKNAERDLKLERAVTNRNALNQMLVEAQPNDTVLIPENETFVMLGGVVLSNKSDVTIDVSGTLHYLYDTDKWTRNKTPKSPLKGGNAFDPALALHNCSNVLVTSSSAQKARLDVNWKTNDISLVEGGGMLVAEGQPWWYDEIFRCLKFKNEKGIMTKVKRPRLLYVMQSTDIIVEHLTLVNSPYWSFTYEANDSVARYVNVFIKTTFQLKLEEAHAKLRKLHEKKRRKHNHVHNMTLENIYGEGQSSQIPFLVRKLIQLLRLGYLLDKTGNVEALNTDGIDPQGQRITVHDCIMKNADDSVAVKPMSSNVANNVLGDCTTDIIVKDCIMQGVGASIGGVHPNINKSCVRNVIFDNIRMPGTKRGVYIKPDGSECKKGEIGIISNITYSNIEMNRPTWWPIWLGPQQQGQPSDWFKETLKCSLLWPFKNTCPPPPCVNVSDITLKNIHIENPTWIWDGAIIGPAGNDFENVVFENVTSHRKHPMRSQTIRWILKTLGFKADGRAYAACENVNGTRDSHTRAGPQCLEQTKTSISHSMSDGEL